MSRQFLLDKSKKILIVAIKIVALGVASMGLVRAQSAQTSDTEEQRHRTQSEAQEREQQRLAPNVSVQTDVSMADANSHILPVESPCFQIQNFELLVPKQFPLAVQEMGDVAASKAPFLFAHEYLAGYKGACVGKKSLEKIVERLGVLILRKGYSTTRVGIADQDLSSGKLTITLIPGVIRDIRFTDPAMSGTWKTAFPSGPGILLNLRDLEQGMEQMKRVISQDVEMNIIPGELPGQSDVLIEVKRDKPWRLTATLDDSGAEATGKLQAGLNLALDNLFGLNDVLSAGLNNDADRKSDEHGTRGKHIDYSIPAGYWRFAFTANSYDYHEVIAGFNQNYISSGRTSNAELKIADLFQRDRSHKNTLLFNVGKRWNHAYIDDTEIAVQDRATTFAELGWLNTTYIGRAQFDMTLSNRWGVNWLNGQKYVKNFDGQLDSDTPNLHYTLQTLDATLSAPFAVADQAMTYITSFRGQTTHSPLYLTEQFNIGNRYTVRGFDGELTLTAERGFFWRNELDLPLADSGQVIYGGIDMGKVAGPNTANLVGDKLAGAVIGIKGAFAGFFYDIFSGWHLYQPDGFRTATPAVGFSLSYQY